VAAVRGLVGAFDLDGDGGLASFADGDLFVVALDGLAVGWGSVSLAFLGGENESADSGLRGDLHPA